MPFFALRPYSPTEERQEREKGNPPRQWTDLEFLNRHLPKSEVQKPYGMLEVQVSFVICGSDHRRWIGYAFVDTEAEGEDLADGEFPYEGAHEDPIAMGGAAVEMVGEVINANNPIWDPREYFLIIVEIRMIQVLKEWQYVVRKVQRSITQCVCCPLS